MHRTEFLEIAQDSKVPERKDARFITFDRVHLVFIHLVFV